MGRIIKRFSNGAYLEYDRGKYDDWCVYLARPGQPRIAPRDEAYFGEMLAFSKQYGSEKLYKDFMKIYEHTGKQLDAKVLLAITRLCQREYGVDALQMDILFTTLYAGMVAEENKKDTQLGRLIKGLGVHGILKEGLCPKKAANFMKGKKWKEIESLCTERKLFRYKDGKKAKGEI